MASARTRLRYKKEVEKRKINHTMISAAVAQYRKEHKRSRAIRGYVLVGSGALRRVYTCTCCRKVIDTESAKWRPTEHSRIAVREHLSTCKKSERLARKFWNSFAVVALEAFAPSL